MGLYGIVWDLMGFNGIVWDLMGLYGILWDLMGFWGGFMDGGVELRGCTPKRGRKGILNPPQNGDLGSKCPKFGFLCPHMGRFGVFFGVPP